jgi:non-ribosomal peptide synthetase-like protein
VLKAGATFVPIDPASPPDRVDYICQDAGLDLLLTTSDLTGSAVVPTLLLDEAADAVATEPDTAPELQRGEHDPLCYIIYTSGSTGRPKGVGVAHSSICNFINVVPEVYDVHPDDRVYQGMTISFDFSIEEIWPTFAVGATVVVGPTDSRRLGAELANFLDDSAVTVLYCVPTLLATIPRDLPRVRALMVGGEACPAELVDRWARDGRRMLNTYGPTEATVTATWGELLPGKPVTIGWPMPTYSIVLLDEDRQEVRENEVGEICIGGPGVAVGYIGMADKTADRFIEHRAAPIGPDGRRGRLYRTGDLGRIGANGEIVYLGRADAEVKIRGHRVDLGEIESVLLQDLAVESAVAALVPVGGSEQLAAFVACRGDDQAQQPVSEEELTGRLHARLRAQLPDYMVPGYVEVLADLPTMVSGKVDRSKLPTPSRRVIGGNGPLVPPKTELEERVRGVWAEALGLEADQVSVEADFFSELGGHSLLVATVVSLLRERDIAVSVGVRDLYDHPSVRALANKLSDTTDPVAAIPPPPRLTPRRHSSTRYGLAGYVQSGVLYCLLLVITLPLAVVYFVNHGLVSPAMLRELPLAATTSYLVTRWLLAPVLVRALSTGIRPGRYPLWGRVYLRLWAMNLMLSLTPLPALSGSPLLPGLLRFLGARVGRDTHIGTPNISLPSMIRIAGSASIGYGASLRPWVVEDGWVVVAPITIGEGAHVGANAVLEPGTTLGAHAVLAAQSAAGRDQHIPSAEHWAGSPSARTSTRDSRVRELAGPRSAPRWTKRQLTAAGAAMFGLEVLSIAAVTPSLVMVWTAMLYFGLGGGLIAAALVGPLFVATVCVLVALGRRCVLPRTPIGVQPARSNLGLRKWFADKLLEMSLTYTNPLYSTLYTVGWLRLLGARIERGAEVSTAGHLDPDLLTLGRESFIADMASLGSATFHNGWMLLRRTEVGQRSFVGNAALIPAGTRLGAESLIGVASVPPTDGVPAGTTWLGSPPIHLPNRQGSGRFAESLTYRPTRIRVAERLVIEFFRATAPASLISVALYVFLLAMATLARHTNLAGILTATPLLALGTGLGVFITVAMIKWLVVGTYRPRVEPLWNRFVRRTEFVTALYEAAAVPSLLAMLVGSPMLPPALRLLGAHIGRRTFIGTTYLTEFDLVEVDDDAAIGRDVSLQTHLFEDRVMKMSSVHIGPRASVGDRSIVLYDATVGADAVLSPLSLVMKGEQLSPDTRWRGIPAQRVTSPRRRRTHAREVAFQ